MAVQTIKSVDEAQECNYSNESVTHEQRRFHVMAFMVLCQVAIRFIVICGDFKMIN